MRKVHQALGVMAILALAVSCAILPETWPREPFTPEAWKAVTWEERYRFYETLEEAKLLDGASRERVFELLGKPDGKDRPDNVAYLVRKRRLWICGYRCSDVRVLDIRLGPDGKVERYFIRGT